MRLIPSKLVWLNSWISQNSRFYDQQKWRSDNRRCCNGRVKQSVDQLLELVGDVVVHVSVCQVVLFCALRSSDASPRLNWRRSSSTVFSHVCLGLPGRRLQFLGVGDMQACRAREWSWDLSARATWPNNFRLVTDVVFNVFRRQSRSAPVRFRMHETDDTRRHRNFSNGRVRSPARHSVGRSVSVLLRNDSGGASRGWSDALRRGKQRRWHCVAAFGQQGWLVVTLLIAWQSKRFERQQRQLL